MTIITIVKCYMNTYSSIMVCFSPHNTLWFILIIFIYNLFFNVLGPTHQFWLNNCNTMNQNNTNGNHQTKLGFICERTMLQSELTTRHLILIVFLCLTTTGAIFVYIIGRCCYTKKENDYIMEFENPTDFKDTEMKWNSLLIFFFFYFIYF